MIRRRQFLAFAPLAAFAGCGRDSSAPASGTASAPKRPNFIATTRSVGVSMLPSFGVDEMVALELCAFHELRARDTIVYWHNETAQWVHHRLIERHPTDGRWLAQGDNNSGRDWGRVTADEFVGRTRKLLA